MQEPGSARLPDGIHIDKVLEEMRREFQPLMLQRAAVLRRIGTIKQIINGLANLLGVEVLGQGLLPLVGQRSAARPRCLTRTCLLIWMESTRPLMSQEVCQEIE